MQRRTIFAMLAVAAAAVVAVPAVASPRHRVEEPAHRVVATHDQFTVRQYEPRLLARVRVEATSARQATRAGFRILAGFIFGDNRAADEIAMTTPVGRSQPIEMTAPVGQVASPASNTWEISFTMPSRWTLETLPRPNDERIRIEQAPATRYAVAEFSGSPGERTVARREQQLRTRARAAGYTVSDAPAIYNRYDPPWIPGFARRNELWVELSSPE